MTPLRTKSPQENAAVPPTPQCTITLSDGGVWSRIEWMEKAFWMLKRGAKIQGPIREPFISIGILTAADYRAIADVLDPPAGGAAR